MKAIFKDKKKLVLNSADSNEQLVLEEFIKKAQETDKYTITYTKLLDINSDVNGMMIELVDVAEPSTPTEAVEDYLKVQFTP